MINENKDKLSTFTGLLAAISSVLIAWNVEIPDETMNLVTKIGLGIIGILSAFFGYKAYKTN